MQHSTRMHLVNKSSSCKENCYQILRNLIILLLISRQSTDAISLYYSEPKDTAFDRALAKIADKYDNLSPTAKFATGAAVGYASARVVIGSATTALKAAGTFVVVSEVLYHSGALQYTSTPRRADTLTEMQNSFKKVVRDCRAQIHQAVNPNRCRRRLTRYIEKDRNGPTGLAVGLLVGFAL